MTELVELGDGALKVYTQSAIETEYIYNEIFLHNCYGGIDLPERPFVLDVGGNIGMFVLFLKSSRPQAEILSFEPMPASREIFARNMALHKIDDVTLHPCALGSRAESNVTFSFYPLLPANSTRHPEIKELPKDQMAEKVDRKTVEHYYHAEEVTADVERLAAFIPEDRTVDLLKIDVEGAEADVLLGVDEGQWPRIRQVIAEVVDMDGRLATICDLLRGAGFAVDAEQAPLTEDEDRYYMVRALRA
jgi:FkbM family methyltransferase